MNASEIKMTKSSWEAGWAREEMGKRVKKVVVAVWWEL